MPKLTKRTIEALPTEAKDYFVWNSQIAGFGVRVMPSGAKTHQAQYRKCGRTQRVSIRRYGKITVDEARKLAKEIIATWPKVKTPPKRSPSTVARQPRPRFASDSLTVTSRNAASPPLKASIAAPLICLSTRLWAVSKWRMWNGKTLPQVPRQVLSGQPDTWGLIQDVQSGGNLGLAA